MALDHVGIRFGRPVNAKPCTETVGRVSELMKHASQWLASRGLALGATGYDGMKSALSSKVDQLHLVRVEASGHFVVEEQPEFVTAQLWELFT